MNTSSSTPALTLYACPVCQQSLFSTGNTLKCDNNHSFDRHKKGYVNLLMSHHKNSKTPGDNPEMVNGRREFLRAGHYQPFADAILETIIQTINEYKLNNEYDSLNNEPTAIVDAGCGEGFYTEQIQQHIPSSRVYGFDISKPAIAAAANNKTVEWCVASSNRPPYMEKSVDMVVSIFSRIEREAFIGMLKPNGYILYAGPGDNHLHNLRSIIYNQVNDYTTDKHHDYFGDSFTLVKEISLQVPIELDSPKSIQQLLSMTPHAHRVSKAGWERLENTQTLSDMGDFKIYLYQLNSPKK